MLSTFKFFSFAVAATAISGFFSLNVLANSGQALYQQCAACHGASGEGNTSLNAPAIAGQFDWYLARQLTNFKQGTRGVHKDDIYGKQMLAAIAQLRTEKDVSILSQYIQSLPQSKQESLVAGDIKNGNSYYQGKCGACHGGQGQGNASLNAPKLAGIDSAYLKRQMENFAKGVRGNHEKDKLGRQMALMAKTTSGKELDDILFYISQQ